MLIIIIIVIGERRRRRWRRWEGRSNCCCSTARAIDFADLKMLSVVAFNPPPAFQLDSLLPSFFPCGVYFIVMISRTFALLLRLLRLFVVVVITTLAREVV